MNREREKKYIFYFKYAVLFFFAVGQVCFSQNYSTRKLKILFVTDKMAYLIEHPGCWGVYGEGWF